MAAEVTTELKEKVLTNKELIKNLAHVDEAVRIAPGLVARDKPWEKPVTDAPPSETRREEVGRLIQLNCTDLVVVSMVT